MLQTKIKYSFSSRPWQYHGPASWFFVSLPLELSKEIRDGLKQLEQGWGRLNVVAQVGESTWKTSIWFDTKSNTYLLPLKAEIRKRENISGEPIDIILWI